MESTAEYQSQLIRHVAGYRLTPLPTLSHRGGGKGCVSLQQYGRMKQLATIKSFSNYNHI